MLRNISYILISCLLVINCQAPQEASTAQKPNIIFIMADDLGYGELGCYGQTKIETPHIDQLRGEGMKFTQFYTAAPVCAPARCMLLTGKHSGHAYVRGNDEWGDRGAVWDYVAMAHDENLEGQRPMPSEEVTIAEHLRSNGYKTGMVGKWGLGAPLTESIPTKQGFDFFYGYNCQRQAHTYYPLHLYENENRVALSNDTIAPRTKLDEGADPQDPASYANYELKDYAATLMFDKMMNFVDTVGSDPLFLYWASPIPHVPLQAPKRWVKYYREKFGQEEPYVGDKGYFPHQHPRAAYAAMVSYLDENVGKLVDKLKAQGKYENTIIFFTSDNGPSYVGGYDLEFFDGAKPFLSERGRTKGQLNEGGIRVPLIVSWPNKIAPGSMSDHQSTFVDVLSTLNEIAGVDTSGETDGISFLPTLLGQQQKQPPYLYWEFPESGGQRALRMGDWKLLNKDLKNGNLQWELYDLKNDLKEQNDLASQFPEIVAKGDSIWHANHTSSHLPRWQYTILGDGESD